MRVKEKCQQKEGDINRGRNILLLVCFRSGFIQKCKVIAWYFIMWGPLTSINQHVKSASMKSAEAKKGFRAATIQLWSQQQLAMPEELSTWAEGKAGRPRTGHFNEYTFFTWRLNTVVLGIRKSSEKQGKCDCGNQINHLSTQRPTANTPFIWR